MRNTEFTMKLPESVQTKRKLHMDAIFDEGQIEALHASN